VRCKLYWIRFDARGVQTELQCALYIVLDYVSCRGVQTGTAVCVVHCIGLD